jgi:hypothetical protein
MWERPEYEKEFRRSLTLIETQAVIWEDVSNKTLAIRPVNIDQFAIVVAQLGLMVSVPVRQIVYNLRHNPVYFIKFYHES